MCILTLYKSYLPCPKSQFPRPEQGNYNCSQTTFTKCLPHSRAFPVVDYGAGRGGQPHPRQRGSTRGWRGAATRGAGRGSRGAPRPRWPAIVLPPRRRSLRHGPRKGSEKGARGSTCGRLSPLRAIRVQRRKGLGPGAGHRSPLYGSRAPDPDTCPPALTSPRAPQLPTTERLPVCVPHASQDAPLPPRLPQRLRPSCSRPAPGPALQLRPCPQLPASRAGAKAVASGRCLL